jgi:hypothetical protein
MQLTEAQENRRDAMDAARQSRNRTERDRIMAGQNHAEKISIVARRNIKREAACFCL